LICRWHQAKAFQQTPRYSRTEGSPLKALTSTRKSLRQPHAAKLHSDVVKDKDQEDQIARTASTPYRLPRLPESAPGADKPKDYVYKQPVTATHFLLRKDPK